MLRCRPQETLGGLCKPGTRAAIPPLMGPPPTTPLVPWAARTTPNFAHPPKAAGVGFAHPPQNFESFML